MSIVQFVRDKASSLLLEFSGEGTPSKPHRLVVDSYWSDNTSNSLILPLVRQITEDTLSVQAVPESYVISVVSSAGFSIGHHIRIINSMADRYYFGKILGIAGQNLTLDTPIDFAYMVGSEVTVSTDNMNVNGSVTPVHFHLRTGNPSIPSSVDITRMIMTCQCSSAVDLNKFGNIAGGLVRGLVFRISNGSLRNIFNVKTNADLAGIGYDWTPYVASNPVQGIDGFVWRLTFAGPEKIGVALRVPQDGQLGIMVQDNLTSLVSLKVILEGHVVED